MTAASRNARRAGSRPVAEPLWSALRERNEPVTVQDLRIQLGVRSTSVMLRLSRWEAAGFVRRDGLRPKKITNGKTVAVIMTEEARAMSHPPRVAPGGVEPARDLRGRQRIWSAIRVLKRFDRRTAELTSEQSRRNVEDYLNCLLRAGYVRRVRPANSMRGQLAEYLLARNTGLKAPIVRHGVRNGARYRELCDPNTGEIHDISPRRGSADGAEGERD